MSSGEGSSEEETTVTETKEKEKEEKREKLKPEQIGFSTPQDDFRRLLKDMGIRVGIDTITSVFFEGDTDSPAWLNEVLKLSNIQAKNRVLIITSWYGKSINELGVTIEKKGEKTDIQSQTQTQDKRDEIDITKVTEEELKEYIKQQKTATALAQLRALREEAEARAERYKAPLQQQPQQIQPQAQMRTVTRPVFSKDGNIVLKGDGTPMYETVVEPYMSGGGSTTDVLSIIASLRAVDGSGKKNEGDSEVAKAIQMLAQKMDYLEKASIIKDKDDTIKRLEERVERANEEHKKELRDKEEKLEDKMQRIIDDHRRDLENLKERFQETIEHRKELDGVIGVISDKHKKEIDELKKRLEHAQTSIERTVVAKGTDTVDKLTSKVGDIAESIVKPMAGVLKDHYATVIDAQRKQLGLGDLKSTVPLVSDDEMKKFVEAEK